MIKASRFFNALFLSALLFLCSANVQARRRAAVSDRQYWVLTADRIARPVLEAAAQGELKKRMPIEQHEGAGRADFAHLEALGRLLCGLAPWLELPSDATEEGALRDELLALAHRAVEHGTNPASPDYMNFTKGAQPLVDAAFLAQAFIRSPERLWGGLSDTVKQRVVDAFLLTRKIRAYENNWLLFSATIEAFFIKFGYAYDMERIDYAVRRHNEWYKGDGAYGDGPNFHWDYYNSFVIQPMLVDVVTILREHGLASKDLYDTVLARAIRYAAVLERLISPEGSYPPVGRSLVYRFGAFQALSQMALLDKLPQEVKPEQVRCALTAVIRRQMEQPGTFDKEGWLTMGFCGAQKMVGESYTCTGSTYLCSVGLLALGLPPEHPFWSAPAASWTQLRAWNGESFPIDHAINK